MTIFGCTLVLVTAVLLSVAAVAGFFAHDPVHLIGRFDGRHRPLAVLYVSGDMGVRFGIGASVTRALAERDLPVIALNSPTAFGSRKSQRQVNAIIADSIREALARGTADRLVLIGQSFGSDMLAVGLRSLPAELRPQIAAIVLVVPGKSAYFRADPTGLAYRGDPDVTEKDLMREVDWAPVMCIYGAAEADSLCPYLVAPNVTRVVLPGGHFLRNDETLLMQKILAVLASISR